MILGLLAYIHPGVTIAGDLASKATTLLQSAVQCVGGRYAEGDDLIVERYTSLGDLSVMHVEVRRHEVNLQGEADTVMDLFAPYSEFHAYEYWEPGRLAGTGITLKCNSPTKCLVETTGARGFAMSGHGYSQLNLRGLCSSEVTNALLSIGVLNQNAATAGRDTIGFAVTGVQDILSLRSAPQPKASIIGGIPPQSGIFHCARIDDTWCLLRWGGQYGYIKEEYLVPVNHSGAPTNDRDANNVCGAPLRSITGNVPVEAQFDNETDYDVRLFWLDYQGHLQLMSALKPGETQSIGTFETHAFLATSKRGCEGLFVMGGHENRFTIVGG